MVHRIVKEKNGYPDNKFTEKDYMEYVKDYKEKLRDILKKSR